MPAPNVIALIALAAIFFFCLFMAIRNGVHNSRVKREWAAREKTK